MICLPGKKKINNAASPPIRAIAYCMSVTYTEIIRASVNHTNVCIIRRFDSFFPASDGGILKAVRYNPSRQLLQDRCASNLETGWRSSNKKIFIKLVLQSDNEFTCVRNARKTWCHWFCFIDEARGKRHRHESNLKTFVWKSSNIKIFIKLVLQSDNVFLVCKKCKEKNGCHWLCFRDKACGKIPWLWKVGRRNSTWSPQFLEVTYLVIFCISGSVASVQ